MQNSLRIRNIHSVYDSWEVQNVQEILNFEKLVFAKNVLMELMGEDSDQINPVQLFKKKYLLILIF